VTLKTLFTDLNEAFREISTLDYGKGILPVGFITYIWIPFSNSRKVELNSGALFSKEAIPIFMDSHRHNLLLFMSQLLDLASSQ
jgi:hypothetical protein